MQISLLLLLGTIERTYEVINWCTYTPGAPAKDLGNNAAGTMHDYVAGENGRYVYTQVIKYSVDQAPEVSITAPDMCINSGCSETKTFAAAAENCLGAALTNFSFNLTEINGSTRTVIYSELEKSQFGHLI